MLGIAAQVFLRHARSVGTAPEIDPVVTERDTNRVDVGHDGRRRILGRIGLAGGTQFGETALGGVGDPVGFGQFVKGIATRQRRAAQRRRLACTSRVDQHDIAVAPHADQCCGKRRKRIGRLPGASGQHDQRIGLR